MSYGSGSGSNISAGIVQACIAQDVGYERCLVLAHCKVSGFRDGPWITQRLLREITAAHPGCKTSLAMASTGCFLHIMEGKGAFVLCITEGRKNLPATYGFLNAVLDYYDGSPGSKGKFSDVTPENPARSQDGAIKSIMTHWNDANVMKTERLKSELAATTDKLQGVIDTLTVRAEKLDTLLDQAEDLSKAALAVQKAGKDVYCAMLKRYYKWIAMIVIGVIIFILLIVAIVCGTGNC